MVGRPKGKKYVQISLTVSPEQADYLKRQPNASELIRKNLEDLMSSESGIIALNKQLDKLEAEKKRMLQERGNYIYKYKDNLERESRWQIKKNPHNTQQLLIVFLDRYFEGYEIPKPRDSEDGRIGTAVLQSYEKVITDLNHKIAEIKSRILAG